MKQFALIRVPTLFLLALAIASCSQNTLFEPEEDTQNRTQITLSAGIDQSVNTPNTTPTQSRAAIDGSNFPANTNAIFRAMAYAGSAPPATDWSTHYFGSTNVNSNAAGDLSFATTRYYPADISSKLYFYAWSPAEQTFTAGGLATPPVAHYILTGEEDILAAQITTGHHKSTTTPPAFQFTHKLLRVSFQLQKELSLIAGVVVNKIEITDTRSSARLNIATGELTFDPTPTTNLVIYDNPTGLTLTTNVIPIDKSLMIEPLSSFMVKITAGLIVYDQVLVTLQSDTAGKAYTVTLTFKAPITRSDAPTIEAHAITHP